MEKFSFFELFSNEAKLFFHLGIFQNCFCSNVIEITIIIENVLR